MPAKESEHKAKVQLNFGSKRSVWPQFEFALSPKINSPT